MYYVQVTYYVFVYLVLQKKCIIFKDHYNNIVYVMLVYVPCTYSDNIYKSELRSVMIIVAAKKLTVVV